MSGAEIINAVGREWVAGLVWRSFAEHPSLRERREDAQSLGADWVVMRDTLEVSQAGFCPAIGKRKPRRLYSLAASIAEEHKQPWLGMFKLSDTLWWYIAVRDGQAILPDGDVVGDYPTVLAARQRHEAYGDWNIHDGTMDDLRPLLEFSRKNVGLAPVRPVEPEPVWRGIAPISLAVLIAVGGILLYQRHERQLRQAERSTILALTHAREHNLPPLLRTPGPDEWLAACGNIFQSLPISQVGWIAVSVSCQDKNLIVIWQRMETATVAYRPEGELGDDGNRVLQTLSLGRLPAGDGTAPSYHLEDDALYRILQPINVQAVISRPTHEFGWAYVVQHVNFTLPISPFGIDFNQVPGLRITSLEWTQSGWVLSGELYGK